jgi:formylglycine-generating enzyme required for sulfatase activity
VTTVDDIATGDDTRRWNVEARGGKAILEVTRAGCAPSVIPMQRLPGYTTRATPPTVVVRIPTCAASASELVAIPSGPFVHGGRGIPPVEISGDINPTDIPAETELTLHAYSIDRTEVSNAAFRMFASPLNASAMTAPSYPDSRELRPAGGDSYPVTNLTWSQARAYCRFLGKELPSTAEWEKAMRGGTSLASGPNPNPRRSAPWNTNVIYANIQNDGPLPVDGSPNDISPYGVLDLAGNVYEWTRTQAKQSNEFSMTRGCGWSICTPETFHQALAIENIRSVQFRSYDLGFRCVAETHPLNND